MASLDIVIYGAFGQTWHVHGDQAGAEGVYLRQDQVDGLIETPVRQVWDANARQVGGTLRGMWRDVRDIGLGFIIQPKGSQTVGQVEDAFRQSFVYRKDQWDWDAVLPRIEITDPVNSTTRSIDVQLYEQADFNPGTDFLVTDAALPILPLRAGQPLWYEDDIIEPWSTTGTSGSGTIDISNPTPEPMYAKFVLTRATAWVLPDLSWSGPPYARVPGTDKRTGRDDSSRTILMPEITTAHGGATVDLDYINGTALMIRSASDENLLGQMPVPGQYFIHEFPSFLQPTTIPVSVSGAPAGGAMVQLVQPRRFERPIGGVQLP